MCNSINQIAPLRFENRSNFLSPKSVVHLFYSVLDKTYKIIGLIVLLSFHNICNNQEHLRAKLSTSLLHNTDSESDPKRPFHSCWTSGSLNGKSRYLLSEVGYQWKVGTYSMNTLTKYTWIRIWLHITQIHCCHIKHTSFKQKMNR